MWMYFTKWLIVLSVGLGLAAVVQARLFAPPLSHTGAPARGTFAAEQNCTACHNGALNGDDGVVSLAVTPVNYNPNQEVQVTLSAEQLERSKFGFQGTALDEEGRPAGQWIVTDRARTQTETVATGALAGRHYIQHTFDGTEPTEGNLTAWRMRWKAPLQNLGRITFFFAVNAANNDASDKGDSIYTRTVMLTPAAALPSAVTVSAASYFLNAPLAPESIGTIFGPNLTNATALAASLPLPTTLADAQVRVRDANNVERDAPLFFVSPAQINFLMPAPTSVGNATITVRLHGAAIATSPVTIARTAPAIFTANADGSGVPAALAFRLKADGAQSFEPVAQYNEATKKFEALPIDLGAESDQVFLVLYGSGFRAQTSASCTIGGQNADVLFAGAQGSLAGLDQANVRLARSLIGRGNLNVVLRADNQNANTVTINVR
jgi:uncharacterized protein (TIGR03437 family)